MMFEWGRVGAHGRVGANDTCDACALGGVE
jgi:hypothetical protein